MIKSQWSDQLKTIFAKINEANPFYLVGGVVFIILAFDFLAVMQFQIRELASIGAQNKELISNVMKTKADIENIPQYQKEIESFKVQLEGTQQKIRSREALSVVLEEVSRAASQDQVGIGKIVPDPSEEKSILKTSDGEYFSIPIAIEAKSGYHQFGHFLNRIERESPFLKIVEFEISATPEVSQKHDMDLTLHAIFFDTMGHEE
ncbi:MAG: type 4a pilus biogenesis protein PilO [Candidatus Omnitrophica bacterium]|nr:type 4a pilus biogenesis protein PilO [Candidatus Omnitrophota bacterium]